MANRYVHELTEVWKRQRKNWRIVVVRQLFNRFFREFTQSYSNIYITKLGASPVTLGIVNSFAGISSTLISVPVGWLQDQYSLRKLFLIGAALLAVEPLIYATANNWLLIIPAIVIATFAMREGSCGIICNVCLENRDRITAKSICEGLGRIPTLFAPILAASIITLFGGISVDGIRPLFWVQFFARCILFIFVAIKMTEIDRPKLHWKDRDKDKMGFLSGFHDLFLQGSFLKRWILLTTSTSFLWMMTMSFRYPFAHDIKGAGQFTIGALASASVLLQIIFYTPLGRVADRVGRKRVLYVLIPLVWVSHIMFILAPTFEILVLASFLYGFQDIVMVIQNAVSAELVPREYMGRWIGVLQFFRGLVSIPAPIIGGIIWEHWGPAYIFIVPILIDLIVRIPLLFTMPETLHSKL